MSVRNVTASFTTPTPAVVDTRPFWMVLAMKHPGAPDEVFARGTAVYYMGSQDNQFGETLFQNESGFPLLQDKADFGNGAATVDGGVAFAAYNGTTGGAQGDGWVWIGINYAGPASRSIFYETQGPYTNTTNIGTQTSYDNIFFGGQAAAFRQAELHFGSGSLSQANFNAIRAGTLDPIAAPGWAAGSRMRTAFDSIAGGQTLAFTADGAPVFDADHPSFGVVTPPTVTVPIFGAGAPY